jgi:hypothetical protein
VIVVYWLESPEGGSLLSQHRTFGADQLREALQFSEALRLRRRAGERVSHVSLQSELPDSVGPAGVGDAPADYAHYKRRIDPAIPLGRPSGPSTTD